MPLRLLPPSIYANAKRLLIGKALRSIADGYVNILLPAYLLELGAFQAGLPELAAGRFGVTPLHAMLAMFWLYALIGVSAGTAHYRIVEPPRVTTSAHQSLGPSRGIGSPLLTGGALKIAYDLALLIMFRDIRPPEEAAPGAKRPPPQVS